MKIYKFFAGILVMTLLSSCLKQRFFPDPYDPALSMLSSKQFQTGTCYINDIAYINYWTGFSFSGSIPYPTIAIYHQPGLPDSIDFSWPIRQKNKDRNTFDALNQITFRIPASPDFSETNIAGWSDRRFDPGSCALYLNHGRMAGTGGIYFIKSRGNRDDPGSSGLSTYYYISGLFEGVIGDTIKITKGRFDFVVVKK